MQLVGSLGLVIVGALVAVAWATLLERKILAGFQLRKGPNKMSAKGLAQPLGDAVKLLLKAAPSPSVSGGAFWGAPVFSLGITLAMWGIFPPWGISLTMAGVVFLCLSSVHVLGVLGAGWGSNNVFSLLGAARAVGLVLSYEIPLVLFLLSIWLVRRDLSLGWGSEFVWGAGLVFVFGWLICLMAAESHRAPFDFVEAESELVSGFNVEYGSWGFVLLFLAEYGALLFMGQFCSLIMFPAVLAGPFLGAGIAAGILCARAAYPRLKIAHMMSVCWQAAVPMSILGFLFVTFALV